MPLPVRCVQCRREQGAVPARSGLPSVHGEVPVAQTAALSALPAGSGQPTQPAWAVERAQRNSRIKTAGAAGEKGTSRSPKVTTPASIVVAGAVSACASAHGHASEQVQCTGDVVAAAESGTIPSSRVVRTSGGSMRLMVPSPPIINAGVGRCVLNGCASGMVPVTTKRAPDDRCGCGYGWLLPASRHGHRRRRD